MAPTTIKGAAPTPQHGAAYRLLIERFGMQDCDTEEKMAALTKAIGEIRIWSDAQSLPTATAYKWAAEKLLADARTRLAIHQNSRNVQKAYVDLPKPPEGATEASKES